MPARKIQPGGDGEQGFACSRLAVAGDERDRGIEQRIEEALLAGIRRAEFDALWNLDRGGDIETNENPAAGVARGKVLAAGGLEKNILVHLQATGPLGGHFDLAGTPESLEFMRLDNNLAQPTLLDIALGDLVAQVVLALHPDRHGAELHVDVLRHEDRRFVRPLLEGETGPDDAGIHAALVGEDFVKPLHRCRRAPRVRTIANENPH